METNNLLSTTKSYYNSTDADEFYFNVWGGEDIHVGIYDTPETKISVASKQTVKKMISVLNTPLTEETKVLDIGSGYGGAARHLAGDYKSQVTCLNLSDKENERNNQKNTETGLNKYISVHAGNFEEIPFEDNQFDVVWCQDAILHSDNKSKVFAEVSRVLKKGGHFIFTDPMQSDNCPDGVLNPILDRIHLKEMGSVKLYRQLAKETGFEEVEIVEMPDQLINHYQSVKDELFNKKDSLLEVCSANYLDKMDIGLQHWVDGGKNNYLNWGILHFMKN